MDMRVTCRPCLDQDNASFETRESRPHSLHNGGYYYDESVHSSQFIFHLGLDRPSIKRPLLSLRRSIGSVTVRFGKSPLVARALPGKAVFRIAPFPGLKLSIDPSHFQAELI